MSDPNNNDGNGDPYIPSDPTEEEYETEEERIYYQFLEYINELPLDRNSHFISNCNTCASKDTCDGRTPIPNQVQRAARDGNPAAFEPWPLVQGHPMTTEPVRTGIPNEVHGGDRHCRYWRLPTESYETTRFFDQAFDFLRENSAQVAFRRRRDEEITETLWDVLMHAGIQGVTLEMSDAIKVFMLPQSPSAVPWTPRIKVARYQIIAQAIVEELTHLGEFVIDPESKKQFYYNVDDKVVVRVGDESQRDIHPQFRSYLQQRYQLYSKIPDIVAWIKSYADTNCKDRPIRQFFYATAYPEPTLYIHNRNTDIYKLTGDDIQILTNGEEQLFYTKYRKDAPITYIPPDQRNGEAPQMRGYCTDETDDLILNCFITRTNYQAGTFLTQKEQFVQAALLFFALPFRDLLAERPLTRWVGTAGSGKTFTPTMWFRFLLHPNYTVRDVGVPNKDDFLVALGSNPYYVMDNVDTTVPFMSNTLAAIATGASIARRILYTTDDEAEITPNNFVFLTSRSPTFQREDLADRSLIFHTQRVQANIPIRELTRPLTTHYDVLWSEFIDQLNLIIRHMRTNGYTTDQTSTHRMSDFALLSENIEAALNVSEKYGADFKDVMDNINLERSAFVFKGDPLLPIFRIIAEEHPNEKLTASQIIDKIKEVRDDLDLTAQGLGKMFTKKEAPLNNLFGFKITLDRRSKTRRYAFGRDPSEDPPPTALDEFISPTEDSEAILEEEIPRGYQELPMIEGFLQWMRDRLASSADETIPFIVARLWLINHYVSTQEEAEEVINNLINSGHIFAPRTNELKVMD